ncbi:MAG: hypothetical protein KC620_07345 [Myxococcales bacterium]|nr:hypothetical protein [Myxococcales bacterium]
MHRKRPDPQRAADDPIDLHLCLPGLLSAAFARFQAQAQPAAHGVRLVREAARLCEQGPGRLIVVDEALWSTEALTAVRWPRQRPIRVSLWAPTAVEVIARLLREPDPTGRAEAFAAQAHRTYAALARAAEQLGAVQQRSLADFNFRVFDAVTTALGVPEWAGRPPDMADWPPLDAEGRLALVDLADVIVTRWRDARNRAEASRPT